MSIPLHQDLPATHTGRGCHSFLKDAETGSEQLGDSPHTTQLGSSRGRVRSSPFLKAFLLLLPTRKREKRERGGEKEKEKKKKIPVSFKGLASCLPSWSAHSASGSTCHFLGVPGVEAKLTYIPSGGAADSDQALPPAGSEPWAIRTPRRGVGQQGKALTLLQGWFPAGFRLLPGGRALLQFCY